jgi:chromosome segregation ATPase
MDEAAKTFLTLLGGGGIVALINAFFSRRKNKADAAEVITQAAASLVKPLSDRVDGLVAEIESMRLSIKGKDEQIAALRAQLEDLQCQITELKDAAENKDGKINRLEAKLKLRDEQIAELKDRVQELEAEVQRLKCENEALRKAELCNKGKGV